MHYQKLFGDVIVDDVRKSVTKETIDKFVKDIDVGIGLTDIVTSTVEHSIELILI